MTRHSVGDARIRVPQRISKGDVILVHSIVEHPMDTGFFRTADGQPIPAWFIKDVVVTYAGQQVAKFTWTSGISRDPVLSFNLLADREGPLEMRWTDNKGATYSASAQIVFGTT